MASNIVFTAEKTEISEQESFSVRRTGWNSWDASLPWETLSDCIMTLTNAFAAAQGTTTRGLVYQVRNVAGNYRPVSTLQWLDTDGSEYLLSIHYDELPLLASALTDLAADEGQPLDLDFTDLSSIKPGNRFDHQLADAVKDEDTEFSKAIGAAASGTSTSIKNASLAPGDEVTVTALPGLLNNRLRQNAAAFTQDPICTLPDGTQYVVWMDDSRNPIIGKRTIPSNVWETFDLSTVAGNPFDAPTAQDGHNSYVVKVDSRGYVHVAGNMHGSPLRYVRSTAPRNITSWTEPGMVGDEVEASYPAFLNMPNGEMLCYFRTGGSSMGAAYLNAYSPTTQTWTRRAFLLDGLSSVPDEGPYANRLALHDDGTLHIFYMWRETLSVGSHHGMAHMKSSDNGATWTRMDGSAVTLPVLPNNPDFIWGPGQVVGALNQSGAAVDENGYPWSIWWKDTAVTGIRFSLTVVRWDGATWVEETVRPSGQAYTDSAAYPRPQLIRHEDRMFALYQREPAGAGRGLWISDLTPGAVTRKPDYQLIRGPLARYEPVFDSDSVARDGVLHLLVTPIGGTTMVADDSFSAESGMIATVDLSSVRQVEMSRSVRKGDSVWVPASRFTPIAAGPTFTVLGGGGLAWAMDAAVTEEIVADFELPSDWQQYTAEVWWAQMVTGTGNVYLDASVIASSEGNIFSNQARGMTDILPAAHGTNTAIVVSSFPEILYRPSIPVVMLFRLKRGGAVASDTFPGDIGILGVRFKRVI